MTVQLFTNYMIQIQYPVTSGP